GVSINYQVSDHTEYTPENDYDVVSLIYAHLPPIDRIDHLQKLGNSLKKGGRLIFEGFGKKHLEYQRREPSVGGSKEEAMLFSDEEVRKAFTQLDFVEFVEGEVERNEGEFHKGAGWVSRLVAQNKLDDAL